MFPELPNRKKQELLKYNIAETSPKSLQREGDETVESSLSEKSASLLRFLKDTATLRRKRIPAYGAGDRLLWFGEVPKDRPECRSAFFADNPAEIPDLWIEVRKKRMPIRPPVPELAKDWFRQPDLDKVDQEPELLPEITVLIEKRIPDPDAPPEQPRIVIEKVPEVRRLKENPEVEDAWLEYLVNQWEPWVQEMHRWQEVQRVYEDVDFMRRRLEESEERYELVLGVGLLIWCDSTGTTVKRHLLTASAEIGLDASRGILTVGPAASFEKWRVELDMLELQNQPQLEGIGLDDLLEELEVQAWDRTKVGEILRIIANRASPNSQVDENSMKALERADEILRLIYAPALVLRERRPTAYEELINRLLKASKDELFPTTTKPWERFLREGAPSEISAVEPVDDINNDPILGGADYRLYFPLPTNEEQKKIADRLRAQPYVLVKGPPGTGKSHTIANLISHLLACKNRILVTAHASKALTVLMDLLPTEIRNLCVTALGSTREDQRLLEDSVRGILWRKNEWKGEKWAQKRILELELELRQLEDRRVQIERGLRECREAETYSHTLLGGYEGTAGQIARRFERDRQTYDWIPELSDDQIRCPLRPADIAFLAEVHSHLNEGIARELLLETGTFLLPDPNEFRQAIARLEAAEKAAENATKDLPPEQLDSLRYLSEEVLETNKAFLIAIEESVARARRVLGDLTDKILQDLLVGQEARWDRLSQEVAASQKSMDSACERAGTARVDLPCEIRTLQLLTDSRRRLIHFQNGGRRGWGVLAPRIVRDTRYVEEACRIDGQIPREPQTLKKVVAFLDLKGFVEQISKAWPTPTNFEHLDPRHAAKEISDLENELNRMLELFKKRGSEALVIVPVGERVGLAESNERTRWLTLINAEVANRIAIQSRGVLEEWMRLIRNVAGGTAHPCIDQMAKAIEERDSEKWKVAWETRERIKAEKERFGSYQAMVDQLEQACPGIRNLIYSRQGDPEWKDRLLLLEQSWAWSAARLWIHRVSDSDTCRSLRDERHRLQDRTEKKVEELAGLKAWQAFFERLDDPTEQSLAAWTKAVDRIGKGTGKYAYRHRRTARQYLMACIPEIPAWIMPLHKLWESANPEPGLFDTIIIDEASQAGIESLCLLLLAKRIIVVGDDKQNSPEAVGVLEDDIARLARDHLRAFRFRDEFRPDTSLFDHAERAFGNLIPLREHFRCVPEIIRFSNDLCYSDAPLTPLRQPPPNRLQPLQSKFVDKGACEGEGTRIVNRAEVERIVSAIQGCVDDEAYEGKTMGVIVLQGHDQARLIEKKLAELLEPKIREERKLRCGVPATFQGDQRDVIFLSLVVAPDYRYRALTGLADERRFNVAMSRARDQVWLFHSVQQHDLSRGDLRWRLLNFFYSPGSLGSDAVYEELDRLEREAKRSPRQLGGQPDPYESWFEIDVALELLRRKFRIRPQFEVADKRIDLVVEGLENRLGVECDGDAWHGPERYEQDMSRQRQLERAGWTFVRIRESEFYADRALAIRQILEECERLDLRPVDQEQPPVAPESIQEVATVSSKPEVIDDKEIGKTFKDEQEGAAFSENDTRTDFGPFTGYSDECGFPDPREASPTNVRAALRRIIEKDGPLTRDSVYRLYVEGCPDLQRVGKAVRQAINRALGAMLRSSEIVQEDELGDGSPEGLVVRLAGFPKVRERTAGRRDLMEVPPSELLLALDRIHVSSLISVQDDELESRSLLDHYGFTRLTEVRRRHLAKILKIRHKQTGTSTA